MAGKLSAKRLTSGEKKFLTTQQIESSAPIVSSQQKINPQEIATEEARADSMISELQQLRERDLNEFRGTSQERQKIVARYHKDIAYWQGYKGGLFEISQKLNSGQLISTEAATRYASQMGQLKKREQQISSDEYSKSKQAYEKLMAESSFAPVFKQAEESGAGINWADPEQVKKILEQRHVQQYPSQYVQQKTSGKLLTRQGFIEDGEVYIKEVRQDPISQKKVTIIRSKSQVAVTGGGESYTFNVMQPPPDITPEELEKARGEAYGTWKEERKQQPYYLDFEQRGGTWHALQTPSGERQFQPPGTIKGILKGWSGLKKIYEKIPEGTYQFGVSSSPFATKRIDFAPIIKKKREEWKEKPQKIYSEEVMGLKDYEKIEQEAQRELQLRFEDKYIKGLIYGETTFKQAEQDFMKSRDYKVVEKKYQSSIEKSRQDISLSEKIGYGLRTQGYFYGEKALWAVESPKHLLTTAGGVYLGYKAFSLIPSKVILGVTTVEFAKGTHDILSPTSTSEKVGAGIVTAGISGGILGYSAYKWLKTPVIRTKRVEAPIKPVKEDIEALETRLTKLKTIKEDVFVEHYEVQNKLSRQVLSGRRTIVTTKGRRFFGLKNIYEGIPAQSSNYGKALKAIESQGISEAKAKGILRYYAPKFIETKMRGKVNVFYSGTAPPTANIELLEKVSQPVRRFTIEGTKIQTATKGAKTYERLIKGQSVPVDIEGMELYAGQFEVFKKGKSAIFDVLTAPQDLGSITVRKIKADYSGAWFTKDLPAERIRQFSYTKPVYPRGKRVGSVEHVLRYEIEPAVRVDIDLTAKGFVPPPAPRPFSKYTKADWVDLDETIQRVYGKKAVEKILKQAPPALSQKSVSTVIAKSRLKTVQLPSFLKPQVKMASFSKTAQKLGFGLGFLNLNALMAQTKLRAVLNAKLQQPQIEASVLRISPIQKQPLKLREAVMEKSGLKSALIQKQIMKTISTTSPPRFIYKPPKFTFMPFATASNAQLKKLLRTKMKKTSFDIEAYLPDFTARSLGLSPKSLGMKDAIKEIKKIQTGLEIRKGLKIRLT